MWWLKEVWVIDPSQNLSAPRDVLVKGGQVLEMASALTEEEVVINARAELANVAGAKQKLVTGHFGVCRGLAKSGHKKLGPAMHRDFPAGIPAQVNIKTT